MKKRCFVVCPIGSKGSEVRKRADDLLDLIIEPALRPLDYEVIRADHIYSVSSITGDIIKLLAKADLVIADLTDNNSNVMYEIGVRHALNRPTIMMAQDVTSIPFDLAGLRTIVYRLQSPREVLDSVNRLRDFANAVDEHISPVAAANVYDRYLQGSTQPDGTGQVTDAVLMTLAERIGSLEKQIASMPADRNSMGIHRHTRDVFIVHGHDSEMKVELARLLERLEFNPIILHEQPERGQTIIQKLQFESARAGYCFILHTPDDEGRKRGDSEEPQPRSQQNVVFEHGMFLGKFGAERVCAIVRSGVEIPSDLSGVAYKYVSEAASIMSIALDIVKELRGAGYVVDANKIA